MQSPTLTLAEKLATLARETGVSNWNRMGAVAIPPTEWECVRCFCGRLQAVGIPMPFPAPGVDGSIHLYWTLPDASEFYLEVRGTTLSGSITAPDDSEDELVLASEEDALKRLLEFHGSSK